MHSTVASQTKQKMLTFWMIVLSGLGGILYGYDVGVFSGAMPFIQESIFQNTDPQNLAKYLGIIGGAVFGGGLVGTLITGYLADQYGRRNMIVTACVVFLIGVFTIVNSTTFTTLLLSRLVLGVGVGIVSVAVPLYLAEVAPTNIRGKSVAVFQLFLTIGILLAYLVDFIFAASHNWQAMFMVITIPSGILLVSMLFLPSSPRWLVTKFKYDKALSVLQRLRSPEQAVSELQALRASVALEQSRAQYGTWRELFSKRLALALTLAVFVAVFNQLTAINGFLQYAPNVFAAAGFQSTNTDILASIALGTINFVFTAIALTLIDKFGRRSLILVGTGGVVISYIYLACLQYLHLAPSLNGYLSLIGLLAFVACFAIGPGVVVWLAMSELFPTEVRGKGLSIALFTSSLSAWLVTSLFLEIKQVLGLGGSYWLFAGCTAIYCFVMWKFLPETKQRTLEQVQQDLHTANKAH